MASDAPTLAQHLRRSPEAYPHTWDPAADAVFFMLMGEADYARASFLDQRILSAQTPGEWMAWARLEGLVADLPERLGLIFHIGHVGSTLISRLLGAGPGVLALREPAPLRQLAQMRGPSPEAYAVRLPTWLKLWSRPFREGQLPIVKATSFASECAGEILARPGLPSALMLYAKPEAYISGILAGPNSSQEARAMAPSRLQRLKGRLDADSFELAAMSPGEAIAMSWASEMTSLKAGAQEHEAQADWMDFDAFLADPAALLAQAFARFGLAPEAAAIEGLIAGPIMRQYSKAPEHAYDARLRAEVLAAGAEESADELRKGLAWLEEAAKRHPLIAEVLGIAG